MAILTTLRNPYPKTLDETREERLAACTLLEEYDAQLRRALAMMTTLSDKLSNDQCTRLGYQELDEELRKFLREANRQL